MKRVMIVGPSGAGKSTLARQLGEILGLPVVHLDKLYWQPGWVEPPEEEFRARVLEAMRGETWVIDGNYFARGAGEERFAACDTVVHLDFPRRICLWRVFWRIVRTYGRVRPDLGEGCPEQFDREFIRWVWDTPKRRPAMLAAIAPLRATKRVVDLRNRGEVARFLRNLRMGAASAPGKPPNRIAIIGSGGAGKSTLARELGERLRLPVVHLDVEHWRPGWVAPPDSEWERRVAELVSGDRWIIDGNYGGTLETRLAAADTIVLLDMSRWRCRLRVVRRRLTYRGRSRPDMAEGCAEKLDLPFLRWVWNYRRDRRPGILRLLARYREGRRVAILTTPREVRVYVSRLG